VAITTHFNNGQQNAVPELAFADSLGHVIRKMTYGFDGRPVIADDTFDEQARPRSHYQPTFANGPTDFYPSGVLSNLQTLDILNRVSSVQTIDSDGSSLISTISYHGTQHVLTNPKRQQRIETYDVLSQLAQVETLAYDNAPYTRTLFEHDPFGNLTKTTDPGNSVIAIGYDLMGHKIQLSDPDLGVINYGVDPIGRTWLQISPNQAAKGQRSTTQYDLMDRKIHRLESDLNSFWTYDSVGSTGAALTTTQLNDCKSRASCGKLVESWTAPPSNPSNKGVDTTLTYDAIGRPSTTTLSIDPASGNVFFNQIDYDAWNRPIAQTYIRGKDPAKVYGQRYNAFGYLQGIQRGSLYLWQATGQDASNRVTQAHLATLGGSATDGLTDTRCFNANTGRLDMAFITSPSVGAHCGNIPGASALLESYTYDPLGNVQQRTESWNSGIAGGLIASQTVIEGFTYDGLNRILTSQAGGQNIQNFSYLADGSISFKTGVGNYTYAGGGNGGPHAVKSIDGVSGSFSYDLNGNQLGGNNRTTGWTSFDMPSSITYTGGGTQFGYTTSQFGYGPEHERRTQIEGSNRVVYYGGAQEVLTDGKQVVQSVKTYWPIGLGVEIDRPAQSSSELNWTHSDRLGSIVGITDQNGNLKEAMAFDAWGSRRNPNGAPVSAVSTQLTEQTDTKGYTGQEMLDALELVHLNGRVYDPLLGKFLSGDPLVSDPVNGQNYNRYSYVLNNPTNLTDPTGFLPVSDRIHDSEGWITIYSSSSSRSDQFIVSSQNDSESGDIMTFFMSTASSGGGGTGSTNEQGNPSTTQAPATQQVSSANNSNSPSVSDKKMKEGDHDYSVWTKLKDSCDVDCIKEWQKGFKLFSYPSENLKPTPADLSGRPQVVYGTMPWEDASNPRNYTTPGGRVVQSESSNGTITNTTLKDHVFCCGTISRTLMITKDGTLYMYTHGVGYNVYMGTDIRSSALADFNSKAGEKIFRALDQQFIKYMNEERK
jgi:RHS repeat-associated protein